MNKLSLTALALALAFTAACSDDDTDKKDDMGTCTGANCVAADMNNTSDMPGTGDMNTTGDMTTGDMGTDQGADQGDDMTTGDMGMTYPPAESCMELSLTECAASSECAADERCQNLEGKNNVPNITCCVKGERGAGMPGDMCDDEFDCESGLCIEDDNGKACSKDCMSDADCPMILPRCSAVGICRPPL